MDVVGELHPETQLVFDYEGRTFRSIENAEGGDVGGDTVFHYHQRGDVVWATYAGGSVEFGTLIARLDDAGSLDMRYHHVSRDGSIKLGKCQSRPELLPDGKLRLHERWQWMDGAAGEGTSVIEEI